MSCPPFDSLHADEHQSHLQVCEACRSLVALASLERPAPEACEEIEGLLCLLDALSPADSTLLHDHLADCPACMVTYLALVEDAHAPVVETNSWKGPGMDTVSEPHMIQMRTAVVGGLVFAAAAVLLVMLVQRGGGDEPVATRPPALGSQPMPGASRPAVLPQNHTPTRPSTNAPQNPPGSSTRLAELVVMSNDALSEKRLEDGHAYCEEAMTIDALDESSTYVCALANCINLDDAEKFDRLVAQLQSPEKRNAASELCEKAEARVASEVPCDEVTCLVAPERPCCSVPIPGASKEERRVRATRAIDRWVEGEKNSEVDVESLVEMARKSVRSRNYERGLSKCELALAFEPDHQQARMVCAIAACNLHNEAKAKSHIAGLNGKAKRAAARQICLREGLAMEDDSVASLVEAAQVALRDSKYAEGMSKCQQALKLDSEHQEAHMLCGIAACNLGAATKAKRHIQAMENASKSRLVKQICIRKGVKF